MKEIKWAYWARKNKNKKPQQQPQVQQVQQVQQQVQQQPTQTKSRKKAAQQLQRALQQVVKDYIPLYKKPNSQPIIDSSIATYLNQLKKVYQHFTKKNCTR